MYLQEESRREKRDYNNYYKKASRQRPYIAMVGKWLGYTFEQMKDHFIYPGVNPNTMGTCRVVYRKKRWWIDEITYSWNTGDLVWEMKRIEKVIPSIQDEAYRQEALKWIKGKVFKVMVIHYKEKVIRFLLKATMHGKR